MENNAKIYNVDKKIKIINKSFFDIKIKNSKYSYNENDFILNENIDCIFLSPPWGGIEYNKQIK